MFKPTDATAALNRRTARGKSRLAQFLATGFKLKEPLPSPHPASGSAAEILLWQLVKLLLLASVIVAGSAGAAERVSAVRVWPAKDYTRITIEVGQPIRHELLLVKNPDRLVLDLEGVDFDSVQREIADKIRAGDPYVGQMRAGRYKPGVVRLVLDLKTAVQPQLFSLKPVAEYGYRLVLDVYPAVPVDPLMALALKSEIELPSNAASSPSANIMSTNSVAASNATAASAPLATQQIAAVSAPLPVAPAATPFAAKPGAKASAPATAKGRTEISARTLIIAIDAGHGGEDPGAHGRHGTLEKNVTLAIARKLKQLVDDGENMRAVLTRDGDYFIPLGGRVEKARKVHANLFVSIHADSFIKSNASGSSVFALSEHGATSAAARWLAKNENEADLIGGVNIGVKDPYLARTLLDLSQTATISDSLKLAKHVLHELGGINTLHRGHVEQAGFAVLKAPDIPSILVETAFISNPAEERRLKGEEYQDKVAHAILGGIKHYFAQNPALSKSKIAQRD